MNNNIDDIAGLFASLASAHNQIGSENFARTLDEFQAKQRSINTYGMIMEPVTSRLAGENEAQIYEVYTVGFCINHPWQVEEHDAQWTTMANCRKIVFEMLARIRYYSATYAANTPNIWDTFDPFSVRIEPEYFADDQRVGICASFELRGHVDISFDAADADDIWSDLP